MAVDPIASQPSVRLTPGDASTLQRLADGATLDAKVIARLPDGVARLRIGGAVIEAKAPPSLTPGSTVVLTVSKTADGVRLLLAGPASPSVTAKPAVSSTPSGAVMPAPARPPAAAPPSAPGPGATSAPPLGAGGAAGAAPAIQPPLAASAPSAPPVAASGAQAATISSAPTTPPPTATGPAPASTASAPPPGGAPGTGATGQTPPSMAASSATTPLSTGATQSASGAPFSIPGGSGASASIPSAASMTAPRTNPTAGLAGEGEASAPPTRAVLNATVHQALARQDDLAPMLSLAAQAMASPAALSKLPVDAPRLLQILLNLKVDVPAEGAARGKAALSPALLKAAVAASGVFLEQSLAKGAGGGAQGDLKAILLALSALKEPAGEADEKPASSPAPDRPAPPTRRDEPEPRGAGRSVTLDPQNVPRQLAQAADAALDRVRLMQYASLDGAVDGAPARHDPQPGAVREMRFDIPFQIGRETHVVPFKVSREAPERRAGEAAPAPIWKLSFAIAVEPIGPVHARLRLHGERLDVRLYAERPEVAERMAAASGELRQALGGEGLLDLDGVSVEAGRPGHAAHGVERRA